jgi:hypothetical protein
MPTTRRLASWSRVLLPLIPLLCPPSPPLFAQDAAPKALGQAPVVNKTRDERLKDLEETISRLCREGRFADAIEPAQEVAAVWEKTDIRSRRTLVACYTMHEGLSS